RASAMSLALAVSLAVVVRPNAQVNCRDVSGAAGARGQRVVVQRCAGSRRKVAGSQRRGYGIAARYVGAVVSAAGLRNGDAVGAHEAVEREVGGGERRAGVAIVGFG